MSRSRTGSLVYLIIHTCFFRKIVFSDMIIRPSRKVYLFISQSSLHYDHKTKHLNKYHLTKTHYWQMQRDD